MKKANFYINMFMGVQEKSGYIFNISDGEKSIDFTLYKNNNYWLCSELSSGAAVNGCVGFINRQQAIDFILQYDAELFYKILYCLKNHPETIENFNKKITDYEIKKIA